MCGGRAINTNSRPGFEHLDQCPDSPARAPEWPSLFPGRAPTSTPEGPPTKPSTAPVWRAFGEPSKGKARGQRAYEEASLSIGVPIKWEALPLDLQAHWAAEEADHF